MPFLITLLVIALIVAFLFLSTLFIVPQQQAYIIERFGKFNKVQFAGIHIRIPFVDRIAMKTNMRVNQLNVQLETKTLDNVFVTVVASTQFRVDPSNVATAYYERVIRLVSCVPTWRMRCVPPFLHCLWTMPSPVRTMWPLTYRRPSATKCPASVSLWSRR